jgi:hypothetical protein
MVYRNYDLTESLAGVVVAEVDKIWRRILKDPR